MRTEPVESRALCRFLISTLRLFHLRKVSSFPRFPHTFRRWAEAPPPREHIVALFADTSCRFHLPKVSSFPCFPHTFRRWANAAPPRQHIVAMLADTSCRFHLRKVSSFPRFPHTFRRWANAAPPRQPIFPICKALSQDTAKAQRLRHHTDA